MSSLFQYRSLPDGMPPVGIRRASSGTSTALSEAPEGSIVENVILPLEGCSTPLLTRNQTSNRFDDSRRSAVAVHPVVEYPDPRGEMPPPSIKEAENESREA